MKTYLKHKIHNVVDIKGLTALEYLDFGGKYKNYEEQHNFWELCYVESGEVTLVLENREYYLKENEIFFIPPSKTHSYICGENKNSVAFVVCFETFSYAMKTLGEASFFVDDVIKNYTKISKENMKVFLGVSHIHKYPLIIAVK